MSLPPQTADSKDEQIRHIRSVYAKAKEMIADNGVGANPANDMTVTINGVVEESIGYTSNQKIKYYFKERRELRDDSDFRAYLQPYFIVENWEAAGHSSYRELLFDPDDGHLLFSYVHSETHAGYVIESRYYYDAKGNVVEVKQKEYNEWSSADGEKDRAKQYLDIFRKAMNQVGFKSDQLDYDNKRSGSKLINSIRNTYTKAKGKVAKNDKSDMPRDVEIIIHSQEDGDCPPLTDELRFYYDEYPNQLESANSSIYYHCYFISEKRYSMYSRLWREYNKTLSMSLPPQTADFLNYSEYLFDERGNNLIFSYCNSKEEGEEYEWRYYFDEKGNCIETRTNFVQHDNGMADKKSAKLYLDIFNAIMSLM